MSFRTHAHPIQLLGFSSRATTANHRGPSSYYLISTAEKPRSSERIQSALRLTPIEYSFWDSRLEPPQATAEDPAATIELSPQRNLGALSALNGLQDPRPSNTAFRIPVKRHHSQPPRTQLLLSNYYPSRET